MLLSVEERCALTLNYAQTHSYHDVGHEELHRCLACSSLSASAQATKANKRRSGSKCHSMPIQTIMEDDQHPIGYSCCSSSGRLVEQLQNAGLDVHLPQLFAMPTVAETCHITN